MCQEWDLNPRSIKHSILSRAPLTRLGYPGFYNEMILFHPESLKVINLSPPAGIEPAAFRLTAERSANWAIEDCPSWNNQKGLVPAVGLEPTTTRLKVLRSTNWAKWAIYPKWGLNPRPRAHKTRALTNWAIWTNLVAVGFEPTKQMHMILSHAPLTRLGYTTS